MSARILRRLGVGVALLLAPLAAACGGNDDASMEASEVPAPPPPTATLAVNDLALGKAIDANRQVTAEMETFAPADTIYASVATTGTATGASLTARWTFEDGQVVDETTQQLSPTGPANTEFHISLPTGFPAGQYTVAILLDGTQVETESFTIQ